MATPFGDPYDPEMDPRIPEVDLQITSSDVVAPARVFKTGWGPKRRFIDVVERLAALADGKPDPGEWEQLGPDPAEDLRGLWGAET